MIVFLDPKASFAKMPANMNPLVLSFLIFALAVWIHRSIRSLSELAQAPVLKVSADIIRKSRVSILIPAKNEEKNIADCVRSFLAQLRNGDEVIVINNCSQDGTERILRELGAQKIEAQAGFSEKTEKSAGPLRYLTTPQTPDGWTGKNFALHLGSMHASGDWLLFTDADTRHEPGSIDSSVVFAEKNSLVFLTLLPRCLARGFWENVMQPCAMGYMGLWFPVAKINDPKSKVYFGNGQYLLVERNHYQRIGGHAGVKEAFLEDFAMMRKTKERNARGMCGFGMAIYGTRMYDSFGAIWRGWRRIYLHAFEQKPWPILRSAASVFFFSFAPFFFLACGFHSGPVAALIFGGLFVIIYVTAFKAHAIVKARKSAALLHPLAALVFAGILLDALQMAALKKKTFWR